MKKEYLSYLVLGFMVSLAIATGFYYLKTREKKVMLFFCRENCSGIRNNLLKDFERAMGYKVKTVNPDDFKNLSSTFKECERNVKIKRGEVGKVSPFFDCEKEKFINKTELKIRIKNLNE